MRENDFLGWLRANTAPHPTVPLGLGDDMAAVELRTAIGKSTALALLKIDQCLDGVHFDLTRHTPAQAGRKAVNRCLSDCAAMACQPAAILIAVALPGTVGEIFARQLFQGGRAAADVFGCPIVGGDTAVWDQRLAITVAALGQADRPPLRRDQARPGDILCVSGQLGGSILGRHLDFPPRIRLAQQLAAAFDIHAMMDISDGLAMDLPRMMQASGVGAVVHCPALPIHPDARTLTARDGRPDWWHALCDGEDYELVFALPLSEAERLKNWPSEVPLCVIGAVTPEPGLRLLDQDSTPLSWPQGGWDAAAGLKVRRV